MPRLRDLLAEDIESQNLGTVTLDWSAFDTNCPRWLLDDIFDIFESRLEFSVMTVRDEKPIEYDKEETIRYKRAFQWIRKQFT